MAEYETIAIEDLMAPLDDIEAEMDRYRRAYKYLLDAMIYAHSSLDPSNEVWQWLDDDIKNARAIIKGEQCC